jgi:hypothetical protein
MQMMKLHVCVGVIWVLLFQLKLKPLTCASPSSSPLEGR